MFVFVQTYLKRTPSKMFVFWCLEPNLEKDSFFIFMKSSFHKEGLSSTGLPRRVVSILCPKWRLCLWAFHYTKMAHKARHWGGLYAASLSGFLQPDNLSSSNGIKALQASQSPIQAGNEASLCGFESFCSDSLSLIISQGFPSEGEMENIFCYV